TRSRSRARPGAASGCPCPSIPSGRCPRRCDDLTAATTPRSRGLDACLSRAPEEDVMRHQLPFDDTRAGARLAALFVLVALLAVIGSIRVRGPGPEQPGRVAA